MDLPILKIEAGAVLLLLLSGLRITQRWQKA